MLVLEAYLSERRRTIDEALDRCMPAEGERPSILHRAMRYSVFCGGKRLRPVLCLAAAEAVGAACDAALIPAISIEVLHTYTLIHDDLPCMDDDALRRGKPTSHIVFGEANALLAGDALLTLAFEWLCAVKAPAPYPPSELARELAVAAGSRGVIGGQVEDLAAEGKEPSADLVDFIHANKTGALIRAAVRMGAIAGGADRNALEALSSYADKIGKAFQITDDILNATSSAEARGKPAGTDAGRGKMSAVRVYGLEKSKQQAAALLKDALTALAAIDGPVEALAAIGDYVVRRTQ